MAFEYVKDNQVVSSLQLAFFQLTHTFRSRCSIHVTTQEPTLVLATRRELGPDSPQTIISSRATSDDGELWFYIDPGEVFFYSMPYDATRDVFWHYKQVYADPGIPEFIGSDLASR